jgi:hypothetical protein
MSHPHRDPAEIPSVEHSFPYDRGVFLLDMVTDIYVTSRTVDDFDECPVVVVCLVGGKEIRYDEWKSAEDFQAAKALVEHIARKKRIWMEHLATLARLIL